MSRIEVHYEIDRRLLASLKVERRFRFFAWIEKLEGLITDQYDKPLSKHSGLDGWFGYFDDDYSPKEALDEDQSYD